MNHKSFYLFAVILLFSNCVKNTSEHLFFDTVIVTKDRKNKLLESTVRKWQHKDIIKDTIPGISLDKAYKNLLHDKIGKNVIIALLDSRIDINHEDLQSQIWHNTLEIPNNNIDDDNNGYIDDTQGWNFLGNKEGYNMVSAQYAYVRYIAANREKFSIDSVDTFSKEYIDFHRAMSLYEKEQKIAKRKLITAENSISKYTESKIKLGTYIPDGKFTLERLKNIDTTGNGLKPYVERMAFFVEHKFTESSLQDILKTRKRRINKHLNIEYNERIILGDDPSNLRDIEYGNNNVFSDIDQFTHSTRVAGLIAATRDNNLGIDGISNHNKIMPVCISPLGDEHDKDIALGIRYAVDNGAKVINMSFGKTFSLHKEWIFDALRYAAKHDVLIVSSAGNGSLDLEKENHYYPNDNDNNGEEFSDTFMLIGAISNQLNSDLLPYFSNYGKTDVDLFAPGHKIYTTFPKNNYKLDSGTSLAAGIVSGVAGLIRSYYPDLSAIEVKNILMESGTRYNIKAEITVDDSKKIVPFSSLSKSGRVVNAYNALLMAEAISKSKK
ncbi:S8 family serine peptidase [Aquimarina sp. LLG6339-5]|uniref:S8 family serine peptidase n=1 Tax=Aquimarina sp. LLG6339-5 TaxID=3160830 RepID=UPI0038708589